MSVYFAESGWLGPIKIGFTDGPDASGRITDLQTGNPWPITELLVIGRATISDEKAYHHMFRANHMRGEWFAPSMGLLGFVLDNLHPEAAKLAPKSESGPPPRWRLEMVRHLIRSAHAIRSASGDDRIAALAAMSDWAQAVARDALDPMTEWAGHMRVVEDARGGIDAAKMLANLAHAPRGAR